MWPVPYRFRMHHRLSSERGPAPSPCCRPLAPGSLRARSLGKRLARLLPSRRDGGHTKRVAVLPCDASLCIRVPRGTITERRTRPSGMRRRLVPHYGACSTSAWKPAGLAVGRGTTRVRPFRRIQCLPVLLHLFLEHGQPTPARLGHGVPLRYRIDRFTDT